MRLTTIPARVISPPLSALLIFRYAPRIGWVHDHNDRRFNSERAAPCLVDFWFFAIVRPMLSDQIYVIEMGKRSSLSSLI